jgi:hypothetical protein
LLEGDAAQFDREAPIVGLSALSRKQHGARLVEPPKLRERHAVAVVDFCSRNTERLSLLHNLLPAFFLEQFADGFDAINLRGFGDAYEANAAEQDCEN